MTERPPWKGGYLINIDKFAYFLSIVEEGSFSSAARKHYISQTAVSLQIAALEKELGCVLFLRMPNGAVLTDAGRRLLPYARELMDDVQKLKTAIHAAPSEGQTITVACMGPVERYLLSRAYILLRREQSDIRLRPLQLPCAQAAQALQNEECDLVLTIPGDFPLQGLHIDIVAEYPTCAAVSPVHEFARRSSVTLAELQRYPFIVLRSEKSHSAGNEVYQWALETGFSRERLLTADSIDTQLFMVSLDQGVSLFPASPALRDRNVHMLDVSDFSHMHRTIAVCRCLTPTLSLLISTLAQVGSRA